MILKPQFLYLYELLFLQKREFKSFSYANELIIKTSTIKKLEDSREVFSLFQNAPFPEREYNGIRNIIMDFWKNPHFLCESSLFDFKDYDEYKLKLYISSLKVAKTCLDLSLMDKEFEEAFIQEIESLFLCYLSQFSENLYTVNTLHVTNWSFPFLDKVYKNEYQEIFTNSIEELISLSANILNTFNSKKKYYQTMEFCSIFQDGGHFGRDNYIEEVFDQVFNKENIFVRKTGHFVDNSIYIDDPKLRKLTSFAYTIYQVILSSAYKRNVFSETILKSLSDFFNAKSILLSELKRIVFIRNASEEELYEDIEKKFNKKIFEKYIQKFSSGILNNVKLYLFS